MNPHSSLHSRTLSQFLSITRRQQRISGTSLVQTRTWFGAWFCLPCGHQVEASPALSPQHSVLIRSIQPDPGVQMTSSSLGVSLPPSALSLSLAFCPVTLSCLFSRWYPVHARASVPIEANSQPRIRPPLPGLGHVPIHKPVTMAHRGGEGRSVRY